MPTCLKADQQNGGARDKTGATVQPQIILLVTFFSLKVRSMFFCFFATSIHIICFYSIYIALLRERVYILDYQQ